MNIGISNKLSYVIIPLNRDDSNSKNDITAEIGKACSEYDNIKNMDDKTKAFIADEINNKLSQQLGSSWFLPNKWTNTTDTASKVYACVLLYTKFNDGKTPTSLAEINTFLTGNFNDAGCRIPLISTEDVKRNKSEEYRNKIVTYLNNLKSNFNTANVTETRRGGQNHNFKSITESFNIKHKKEERVSLCKDRLDTPSSSRKNSIEEKTPITNIKTTHSKNKVNPMESEIKAIIINELNLSLLKESCQPLTG